MQTTLLIAPGFLKTALFSGRLGERAAPSAPVHDFSLSMYVLVITELLCSFFLATNTTASNNTYFWNRPQVAGNSLNPALELAGFKQRELRDLARNATCCHKMTLKTGSVESLAHGYRHKEMNFSVYHKLLLYGIWSFFLGGRQVAFLSKIYLTFFGLIKVKNVQM